MKNKSNIRMFFKDIIKHNRLSSFACLICMLIITCFTIVLPKLLQYIIDEIIQKGNLKVLLWMALVYIAISLVNMGVGTYKESLIIKIKKKTVIKFKLLILKKVSMFSGKEISNIKTGEILNLLEGDANMLESCGIDIIFDTISNALTAMLALVILFTLQKDMLFFVLVLELFVIGTQIKFTKVITKRVGKLRVAADTIYNLEQQFLSNTFLLIITKAKRFFLESYLNNERKFFKKAGEVDGLYAVNNQIGILLSSIINIFIYAYGGYKIILGSMSMGELIAFSQYIVMFVNPCISLLKSNSALQKLKVSIDRINSFLNESIEIKQNNKGICLDEDIQSIRFREVSFSYGKQEVIKNLTLTLERGRVYAFVGESGCGKSTIVNLLYRLWDADKGDIFINDNKIKNYNLKNIRKKMTICSQNTYMLDDTIKNNILLGNPIDDKQYEKICEIVELGDMLRSFPEGDQTFVGENAVKLSGGQRQRIALARVLVNQQDILIFDESTSALDNITQNRIMENISYYFKDKIVILIAHRLTTIRSADEIFVMNCGVICEKGTHEQLMKTNGYYTKLLKEEE